MKDTFKILPVLWFFFAFIVKSYAYTNAGEQMIFFNLIVTRIRDLEYQDSEFLDETLLWELHFALGIGVTSTCANYTLLGGYPVISPSDSMKRVYENLPPHNFISITFALWRIDSLDSNDGVEIFIDNSTYFVYSMSVHRSTNQLCGIHWLDGGPLSIIITQVHNASNLTLTFINKLDQFGDDESIGFRDIRIELRNQSSANNETFLFYGDSYPLVTNGYLLECPFGFYNNSIGCTPCDPNCSFCLGNSSNCLACNESYFYFNGRCEPCHPDCRTCLNASINHCTSCFSDRYLHHDNYCRPICLNVSTRIKGTCNNKIQNLLYPQGYESLYCPSALRITTPKFSYCNLTCASGTYYYPNGSCIDSCSSLIRNNVSTKVLICEFKCKEGVYLYPNGSCISTCEYPYIKRNKSIIEYYCDFRCPNGQYVFENNTCTNDCNYPYIQSIVSNHTFCLFPCNSSEFFYSNQSCLKTCQSPFSIVTFPPIDKYCKWPCNLTQYFLSSNNSCLNSCPLPFLIHNSSGFMYCHQPCKIGEYYYPSLNTCILDCPVGFLSKTVDHGVTCTYKCKTNEFYFKNDTCSRKCDNNFKINNILDQRYCDFPCETNQFLSNSSCISNCPSPSIITNLSVGFHCKIVIEEHKGIKTVSEVTGAMISATAGAAGGLVLVGLDPTTAVAFFAVLQSFYYLLFFNVEYPETLKIILGSFAVAKLNFIPNPLEYIYNDIPVLSSPPNFFNNEYTGLFFQSAGPTLLVILSVSLIYPITFFYSRVWRRKGILKHTFGMIYHHLKLKTYLRIILMLYMELVITSLLQIEIYEKINGLVVFSIFAAYVVFLACLSFPYIILRYINRKTTSYRKLKLIEPIIEDYDLHHKVRKLFGFFLLKKRFVHSVALVGLYYVPLLQTSIPLLCNIFLLLILVKYKPHNRLALNLFDTVYEIGYLALHCCVVCLAYLDTRSKPYPDLRDMIGYFMIGAVIFILVVSFIQIWIENIINLKKTIKKLKNLCKNEKEITKSVKKRVIRRRQTTKTFKKVTIN